MSRGGGPGWAPLLEAFEAAGVNLDRAVATPGGWVSEFEIGIRATTDREESKKTSERMLDVRGREAREGKPRPSGQRGFGYTLDWMTIVEPEARLIREAAGRVTSGLRTFGPSGLPRFAVGVTCRAFAATLSGRTGGGGPLDNRACPQRLMEMGHLAGTPLSCRATTSVKMTTIDLDSRRSREDHGI